MELSKVDEQRLVTAYGAGATVSELSRQFRVIRGRVRTILANHEIAPRSRWFVNPDQLAQAVDLYKD